MSSILQGTQHLPLGFTQTKSNHNSCLVMWSAVDKTQSNLSHISILFVWSILFKSIQYRRMCLKSYVNVQKKKKMFPFKLTIHWNTEQLKYWATKTQSVNIFQFKWIGLQLQEFYKRRMIKTIETLRGVSNRLWNAYVHIYMYKKNTMVFCN